MNLAKVDEDDTSNCPDCQLQMLQQQQIQIQPPPPDNNHQHLTTQPNVFNDHQNNLGRGGHYDHHQNVFDSCELRTASVEDFHNNLTYENRRSHNSTNSNTVYKGGTSSSSSSGNNTNSVSSPSSSAVYNLVSSTAAMTATVTLSNHNTIVNNSNNEFLTVPSNMNNTTPCLTPLPLEACDLKSYCATCAVLDLPTNDKYYRSSLSRHSVYPPIFYGQAPPMPGFSPIPDCNSWGNSNDFGSYSYNPYPPQQASATTNDYYSSSTTSTSSTVLPPSGSGGGGHSFTESATQVISNSSSSCSFSFPSTVGTIPGSSSNNNCSTNNNENLCYKRTESQEENGGSTNKGGYIGTAATITITNNSTTPAVIVNDDIMPICISSSSDDDSSDSGSFLSQNEVIVEDIDEEEEEEEVDDEEKENINTANLSLCQVQSERNQKCTICQNPVLTECTSPQLANILENIHDEITAEDLDLSVSSGDIEIGGIEDEVVRDFNPKKQQSSPQITISRLAYLLNVSPSIFTVSTRSSENSNVDHRSSTNNNTNNDMTNIETTMANFCAKCGKLTFMMDSLEKQLRLYSATLKQFLQPQSQSLVTNSPINPSSKSSNLTTLSSTSGGGGEDRSDREIFSSAAVTAAENNICCGDDDCPVERLSRTTHIPSSKILACKLTQTEPFIIIEKSPENLDFDNNMTTTTIPIINAALTGDRSVVPQEGEGETTGSENEGVELIGKIDSSDAVESSSSHLGETAEEIIIIVRDQNNTDITMEEFEKTISNPSNCGGEDQLSPAIITTTDIITQQIEKGSEISPTNFVPENTHHNINSSMTITVQSKNELEDQEINFSSSLNDKNNECLTCDLLEVARKFYLCHECGVVITSRRTFENHCKRHHNELSRVCDICKKQFANEGALRTHHRIHTKEKPFPCPRCSKSFATKSNMNAHHEICKDNILGEKRNEFLISGNNNNSISPSLVTDKLTCDKCGVSFRLRTRLASHQSKGCKSTALECSRCLKKFSKRSEMKAHLLVHDNVKPFTCQICQLSFTTKGNLVSHQRTHSSEKRFTCTICDKAFNRKHALQLHYNRHNGVQPFCCEICNRKFFDPSNLQNHKKIHFKNICVQLM